MADVQTAAIPDEVFRVGRASDLLRLTRIRPDDASLRRAGNRYDVPGGGVLYAATQVVACFGETLARFRPTPAMRDLLADDTDGGFMLCGGVPQDWRLKRRIVTLQAPGTLPFVDVDASDTQAFLSVELAGTLMALGYADNLDISDVRNRDRRLSRAIASWAYTRVDDDGDFLYSGIRYLSRVNDNWTCWAMFEGTPVNQTGERSIELEDPDLKVIADMWDLRVF